MLARQEIRKEIAMFSKETTPPPVAGYRLDNTVSITYSLCFRKYKQFLKVTEVQEIIYFQAIKKADDGN